MSFPGPRPPCGHSLWLPGLMALLLVLVILLPSAAIAAGTPEYPALAVLADPEGRLSLEEVVAADAAGRFQPATNAFAGGYTRQVHWFRFTLNAPPPQVAADDSRRLLLEVQPSYLDDIRLFVPEPGRPGQFEMKVTGDLHPFGTRELPSRNFAFYLHFPDEQPQTLYLRLQTSSTSLLLIRAMEPAAFLGVQTREYTLLGLYYGLMLALLLFNLWQGQWRQDPAYLPFMAHLSSMLLLMLAVNGLVSEYIFPNHPHLASGWVSYFVLISAGLAARFHRVILDIDRDQPLFYAYFTGLFWLALLGCLSIPFGYFLETVRVVLLLSLLSALFGMARAWQLLRQHRVGSRFLMLANLLTLAGYTYSLSGLLGFSQGQLSQIHGIQLSSLLSLLAFNAVLMSRLHHLHKEHQQAQKAAEQAQSAQLAAQLAQQRQGALLSMLTHELKTPLGVIRLALDRLRGDDTIMRHTRTAVSDISAVVNRCMQADLLDKGAIVPQTGPCDLLQILQELREQTLEPGRVQLTAPPQLAPLVSDPLLLRTILANLLDNALKYSPSGSQVNVDVVPELDAKGGVPGIRVTVENPPGKTGHPDPERIYERYYRSPTAYARTGSGLGLFISRQLAERLGIQLRYIPALEYDPIRFSCWIPSEP